MGRAIFVLAMATLLSCTQQRPVPQPAEQKAAEAPVKITQFYASKLSLPLGENALLCYGVENAVALRLEPPIEDVKPSWNRCFEIAPLKTTTFTLTAEDRLANKISQAVTVAVTPQHPQFTDTTINAMQVAPLQFVLFCFKAKGAVAVKGKPGYLLHGGVPNDDCLVDQPKKTTTYQLTIEGADGTKVSKSITVTVR